MDIFPYDQAEIDYLSRKDKRLAVAIKRIGIIEREIDHDIFRSLVSSIVGQQISNKAFETVWGRLVTLLGDVTPESIQNTSSDSIQKCGMSVRKAEYIKGVGEAAKELDFAELNNIPDDEIIKKLSSMKGVGVWTAEMLLIFSLCRKNVLSFGDLAIKRGMCNLYGHKSISKEQFERYRKRYSPYGSIASLYLWELSQ